MLKGATYLPKGTGLQLWGAFELLDPSSEFNSQDNFYHLRLIWQLWPFFEKHDLAMKILEIYEDFCTGYLSILPTKIM